MKWHVLRPLWLAIGLVVDDADDIETIDEAQIEPFTGEVSAYIVGIARCRDRLLLLLDTSLLGAEARSGARLAASELSTEADN